MSYRLVRHTRRRFWASFRLRPRARSRRARTPRPRPRSFRLLRDDRRDRLTVPALERPVMPRPSPQQTRSPYSARVTRLAEALAALERRYGWRGLALPTLTIVDCLEAAELEQPRESDRSAV